MVYSDMTGRRIRLRVKRRTPEADSASEEAVRDDRSAEAEEPAPGTAQEEDGTA